MKVMWVDHVKITASRGGGGLLEGVLGLLVLAAVVLGCFHALLQPDWNAALDAILSTTVAVLAAAAVLAGAGVGAWLTVDAVRSRGARREFAARNAAIDRGIEQRKAERLAAANAPAIEPPRYVVVAERLDRGDATLEPTPVDLDQLLVEERS